MYFKHFQIGSRLENFRLSHFIALISCYINAPMFHLLHCLSASIPVMIILGFNSALRVKTFPYIFLLTPYLKIYRHQFVIFKFKIHLLMDFLCFATEKLAAMPPQC